MPPRVLASRIRLTPEEKEASEELNEYQGEDRPRNRSECVNGPRPCPYVSCRYHLFLHVKANSKNPSIAISFPEYDDPTEMTWTCALDEAEHGGMTLEEIGKRLNVTRERARQIEDRIKRRIRFKSYFDPDFRHLIELFDSLAERDNGNLWDYF